MNKRVQRASIPSALLVSGLFLALASAGVTTPEPSYAAEPAPVLTLTAEQKASLQARESGEPVPVASLLSETTEVIANPDGTFTAEVHAGPTRYRDAEGEWKPVDLTLTRRSDGSVASKGHPRGLVMSGATGAGEHDLARLASGDSKLTLGWSGTLPEPELRDTTATYRDVRPDIDLVIDATRTGFEQFLVVKNRAAAARVKTIAMPWRTGGVVPSSTAGGGLLLRDKAGKYVGHVPPAIMWDATVGAESGDHLRQAPVKMAVKPAAKAGSKALALTPEPDFFSDPATVYPVTIDPSPTLKPGFDTFVQNNISTGQSTSKELKLGSVTEGGTYRARSFIRWPTSVLSGKHVTAATMYLWNAHSWNCSAHEWQVWITDPVGTSTTWKKQPKWWSDRPIAKSTMTKGYSGCTAGYITANVQPLFDWVADHPASALTTGIRAKQSDEDDPDTHSWKKFHSTEGSKDPYVSITYNTKPAVPTNLRIGGKACGSTDPTAFVSKAAGYPSAQATVKDPDGTERGLTVQFFLSKRGTLTPTTPTMSRAATSGSTATVAIPAKAALVENQAYTIHAKTFDGLDLSGYSVACNFTIDSTGPQFPPTVTSSDYPECTPEVCEAAGSVGKSGLFTFGAHGVTDIMQYRYWFDGGAKLTAAAVSKGGGVTVSIDPPHYENALHLADFKEGGPRTLHVVSVDQAGRESGEYATGIGDDRSGGFKMLVGKASEQGSRWKLDEPSGSTTVADSTANGHHLTATGTVASTQGNGDGGTALLFAPTGTLQGTLAVNLLGSRTTAASMRISAASGESTIVRHTQNGAPFRQDELYFDGTTKKVCYRVRVGQTTAANPPTRGEWKACSAQPVTLGAWVRVAGGFDAMRPEAFVSTNGVRTSSTAIAAYTAPATATDGGTAIGNTTLSGAVDDVNIWDRRLHPEELGALAATEAGRWELDGDAEDTTVHPVKHPLTMSGLPTDEWNDFGHLERDTGSVYFGAPSGMDTPSVVRTDESFSVSAWVSLEALPTANMAAVSADGSQQSAFSLGVRQFAGVPKWSFSMANADSPTDAVLTHAAGGAITDDDVGAWAHVVGVYDAAAQTQTLYVDGTAVAAPTARTARWHAGGTFNIGKAKSTPAGGTARTAEQLVGSVDAVRVYAGALTPDMVERLYKTQDGQL